MKKYMTSKYCRIFSKFWETRKYCSRWWRNA